MGTFSLQFFLFSAEFVAVCSSLWSFIWWTFHVISVVSLPSAVEILRLPHCRKLKKDEDNVINGSFILACPTYQRKHGLVFSDDWNIFLSSDSDVPCTHWVLELSDLDTLKFLNLPFNKYLLHYLELRHASWITYYIDPSSVILGCLYA